MATRVVIRTYGLTQGSVSAPSVSLAPESGSEAKKN